MQRAPAWLLWVGLAAGSALGMEAPSGWTALEGCEWREGPHSDGDSIEVEKDGKRMVFRLYFVDCIETNARSTERRASQGRYFGIEDDGTAVRYAEDAGSFTRRALEEPFTVFTRWEAVSPGSDNPSIRAFVRTANGRDLGMALVEAGLAIIRGGAALADHPDGRDRSEILGELREAETQARVAGRGAWAKAAIPAAPVATEYVMAGQEDALRGLAGQTVRVRGVVSQVSALSDRRITFINFEGVPRGGFVAIVRQPALAAFGPSYPQGLAAGLEGRAVEVRGTVTLYRSIPQIELSAPRQIEVLED